MQLKEWVREARKHKGWTQEQLGDAMGVTKGNVSGWENARHEPGYAQLVKIASVTGYSLAHMDEGARSGALVDEETAAQRQGDPPAAYGMEPILAWEHADDLPEGEFVMVPRLDVHLSAGGGREQVEIDLVKENPQAFRAEWIRLMRLKPNKLAAMRAAGESMEPTIHDGDSLLVDTSQTTVQDGKVYALWYDGGERVKRLFRLPGGGLRIVSDNARFPTVEVQARDQEHVRVIGRVVHRSGVGGL
jgi:phage repressor protein C with HTH and peptisase S24 domain